jgi:hypothetical protein
VMMLINCSASTGYRERFDISQLSTGVERHARMPI